MAAVKAADAVSASTAFGGETEAALTALRLAATVDAAATATANRQLWQQRRWPPQWRPGQAAREAAAAAAAFEWEVAHAATAVRMIATTTARDLAADKDAKAVKVALAARKSSQF